MTTIFTALIIDDEEPARILIRDYLRDHPQIEVVGECNDGFQGIKAIRDSRPDLIFLDVQMPRISGFEMLEVIDETPNVIFSTAFDQYAIRAFENNAVDYLLKPYSRERFAEAVSRAIQKLSAGYTADKRLKTLNITARSEEEYFDRLVVRTGSRIKVIPVDEIELIRAEDDYVSLVTAQGSYLKQITMTRLEQSLDPNKFVRVHRSCIVSISRISQIEPYEKDSKMLVMKSGVKTRISRTGLKRLHEQLGI
ncbi:MAG: LytTR family transcriptional regulator DNA-binding domain-containing protein [Bacteroidales bacterium]|nr:LytTR family transcriptional regulator DNA-binding domain-containing protein [Bacteroidales bacterium]